MLTLLFLAISAAAQENDKVYVLTLNYKKLLSSESLSLIKLQIADSPAPDYSLQPVEGYILEIVSDGNKILKSTKFSVPTGAVMLKGFTNEDAQGNQYNMDFTITAPYFSNAKLINIYDKNNINKILEIPIQSQPEALQVKEETKTMSKPNLNWLYIAAPIFLVISLLAYVEIERKKGRAELSRERQQHNVTTLINYATTNLRKGYSKEQIRNALVKNNYNNKEIEEAFRELK